MFTFPKFTSYILHFNFSLLVELTSSFILTILITKNTNSEIQTQVASIRTCHLSIPNVSMLHVSTPNNNFWVIFFSQIASVICSCRFDHRTSNRTRFYNTFASAYHLVWICLPDVLWFWPFPSKNVVKIVLQGGVCGYFPGTSRIWLPVKRI